MKVNEKKMKEIATILHCSCDWFNTSTDTIIDIFFDEDINGFKVEFECCLEDEEEYQAYLEQTPMYALDRRDFFADATEIYVCIAPSCLNEVISYILNEK